MDRDAREAKAMTKELPVKDRMANFWYYKKWWIIGIAVALIVVAITVFEIVNTPQYDLYVGYYSETAVSDETVNRIKETMLDFANDVNDDGVVTISLTPMIASREEESDEFVAVQTRLMSELDSGDNMIFIVDKPYRDYLMSGNNADCFDYELDLNTNPVIMEKIGYSGDLYLLVKSLYERESGDFKKRASHNNAVTIYEAFSNFSG